MKPTSCPFCDTSQSYRYITEGTYVRAVFAKDPACKYHVLIVPKRHEPYFDGLTSEEANEAFELIKSLAQKTRGATPDFIGYNLMSNNGGPAVRQHVMHCHIHVFLRTAADTADPFLPSHSSKPPELSPKQKSDMKYLQQLFEN